MNLSQIINELGTARQRTENAYYCLLNLQRAMVAAREYGEPLTQDQIAEILDEGLAMLKKVVEGNK